ncbi:stage III sporulation protein AF [Oceanobacillus sp. SE10311]
MLTNWITQIIIFILVATIIDLLIPNLSMGKYIKLVLGLILILILLSPIFSLFNLDFEQAVADTYRSIFDTGGEMEEVQDSIELQKSEIESTHDAYILEEMAVQLTSLTDEALQTEYDARITDISFVFADEAEKTYEGLDEVIVYLEKSTAREGQIKPVEKIVINAEEDQELEEADEPIVELLRDRWELQDKKITVYWEGGAS